MINVLKPIEKTFLYLLFLGLIITGCSENIDVRPGKVSGITVREIHNGFFLLDVKMYMENNTTHKIVVRKLSSDVFVESEKIGTVTTQEKVTIMPDSEKEYKVPVKVSHENPGKIGRILLNSVFHGRRLKLEMRGILYIRSGIIIKKIHFDEKQEVPVFR